MLYGNIIFIKKTGGDGSKYPVTDKDIKIGRSEECLIRIYNTQVALEHCQLIIEDNGQAILKDLCKQTILNGNLLDRKEVTLCHGDIFKVGDRLARWEYLPTSKYYRQLLSPTGRLVAVVMPQQRSLEDQSTPGTSTSFVSVLKSTPVGGKRRYNERFASESGSATKMRKSGGSNFLRKSAVDLSKFLTGRHSLKSTKVLLPGTKTKDRKSTSGLVISKTPKKKSRKSTLPSWKVNIVTPPAKSAGGSSPSTKSLRKSSKSPKNIVKNSVMDFLKLESERALDGVRTVRTPQKLISKTSEEIVKSASKTVSKTPLKTIKESPLRSGRSLRSTRSFSKSPSPKKSSPVKKSSPELLRQIHSAKKLRSSLGKPSVVNKELLETFTLEGLKTGTEEIFSDTIGQPTRESNESRALHVKRGSPVKTPVMKTPGKLEKTPRKSSPKKAAHSPKQKLKTPRKSITKKSRESIAREKLKTPKAINVAQTSPFDGLRNSKTERQTPLKSPTVSINSGSFKKTLQKIEDDRKRKSSSRKVLSETYSPLSGRNSSAGSPKREKTTPGSVKSSSIKSSRKTNTSRERISSSRGVRRKLSPSVSSAEIAAKKLKTSSPKKPDKNKKAALLVLGKANRRQVFSQNVKVLLKQKIVKKAIKQSTAVNAQNDNVKSSVTSVKSKADKGTQKRTSKSKKKLKNKVSSSKGSSSSNSRQSEVSLSKNEPENILKGGNVFEEKSPSSGKANEGPQSPSKTKDSLNETRGKYPLNQHKIPESPQSILSPNLVRERILSRENFEKSAENFMFNSNRRCSKRLSSKNDTGRPDFVELSPTALGLMPKNLEIFKTPKPNKRRSSSLVTPKNDQCVGIIRSASTSKVGNRKSVRFLSKDSSISSDFYSPGQSEKTNFDFGAFQTPDISLDVFVSPLRGKTSTSKKELSDSSRITFASEDKSAQGKIYKSNSEPRKCVRKLLQFSQPRNETAFNQKELPRGTRSSTSKSPTPAKIQKQSGNSGTKESEGKLSDSESDLRNFNTPKTQKSPKLSASEQSKQVSALPKTQKEIKSPKNDLSDVRGVKKLLATPKAQKSPKNDLSNLKGVKKLLATPKVQKSPKNDLSDLKGVKKLLTTPKAQKSPKNDLSNLKGVKKLLATPKVQKSPKNDLSDLKGVKKLLTTPKAQKSPKNDLSDVRGVKKLLGTPKVQKSPKNDLSDVRGVKKLLGTPKVQKSPRNDLSDVRGVRKLLGTPKVQKSPKNDLSDLRGVRKLLGTPKVQKSPKNDLSDLRGVKRLLGTPKLQKSPRNDLTDVVGVKELLKSPKLELVDINEVQKLLGSPKLKRGSTIDLRNVSVGSDKGSFTLTKESLSERTSPRLQRNSLLEATKTKKQAGKSQNTNENSIGEAKGLHEISPGNVIDIVRMKQLLVAKGLGNVSMNKRNSKSQVNDVRAVKGSRKVYLNQKGPKNDLSDVTGVRELFSRHEPSSDLDVSLTGVARLFDLPEVEADSKLKGRKSSRKSAIATRKVSKVLESEKTTEVEDVSTKRSTRGTRLRKAAAEETTKKAVQGKKAKTEDGIAKESADRKPSRRKAAEKKPSGRVKSSPAVKRSQRVAKKTTESEKAPSVRTKTGASEKGEGGNSRKRKADVEDTAPSPPKLRRKRADDAKSGSSATSETVKKAMPKPKAASSTVKKTVKSVRKVPVTGKENTAKVSSKVQNKRSQSSSAQNLSDSGVKLSPVKTRSAKSKTAARGKRPETKKAVVEKKISKSSAGRKKLPPVVKRSTRRK